jgi:hypothetical protein
MKAIASDVWAIQARYAANGVSIGQAVMSGSKTFVEYQHYPRNDLRDKNTACEIYYHTHGLNEQINGEHGHFHVFKRNKEDSSKFIHLIGIAINDQGIPVRLFTTNQWVTGEHLVSAKLASKELSKFNLQVKGRLAPVGRWVTGFIKLFQHEIIDLLELRDQKIKQLIKKSNAKKEVTENRRIYVLSELSINFLEKIASFV